MAALLTDRQLRAQEEERQRSNLMVQVEALSRQVKQLEEALQTTLRDYITGTLAHALGRCVKKCRGTCAAAKQKHVTKMSSSSQRACVQSKSRGAAHVYHRQ